MTGPIELAQAIVSPLAYLLASEKIIPDGYIAKATGENRFKIGNGRSTWQELPFFSASSLGAFQTVEEPIDADEYYREAARVFVSGSGNVNFPANLTAPFFFMTFVNDDITGVLHIAVGEDAYAYRLASVSYPEPENPEEPEDPENPEEPEEPSETVTWTDWTALGNSNSGGSFNTRQVITSSGTFTAPVTGWYKITCIGAGGAGGNGNSTGGGGGGGGGGAGYVVTEYIYLTAGQSISVTIGAGSVGSDGGSTSFGSLLSANGGTRGNAGTNPTGGLGGAGQVRGSPGNYGFVITASCGGFGGDGGNNGTAFGSGGGGGGGGGATLIANGGSGQANGGNGGNSSSTTGGPGGKGGDGAIEIEYNDPLKSAA